MAYNYYNYSYDGLAGSSYNRSYVPTTRFTISSNVHLPCGEIDFRTGLPKPDHTRRRTQAARLEMEENNRKEAILLRSIEKETAKTGIQISMRGFVLVVATVILLLGCMLLHTTGQIAGLNKDIIKLQDSIDEYDRENALLRTTLEENSSEAVITKIAVERLGMKHCDDAKAVHLIAPDTRPTAQESTAYAETYSAPVHVVQSSTSTELYNPFANSGY